MVLRLFGSPFSTCSKRVATVLHEKKVPFELVVIDLAKHEQKSPAFREKQPFGQIPYLDDDGFIVYESRAICRYIATKYADQGTKLIPTDLKGLAIFEQALSVEQAHFNPSAEGAISENIYKPFFGKAPDPAVFEGHLKKLDEKLDIYDLILSKQKYLAGDELTLVDLFHIPFGAILPTAGSEIMNSKPHVAKWFKELTERPSWQAIKDNIHSTA
ncbi:hypothetical protein H0H87_011358 [Tephrocybe sp. NHM501043]|nr:hypothetical protein H0H87_011358 [Tephrocybe sp. NHM501043]